MLDEKDNSDSTNSISDIDLKIPKLVFTPLACSSPTNMAKRLTEDLEFNNDELNTNHMEPTVRPLAEIPETITGQFDIKDWSVEDSSFEYFTLPDLQMPKSATEETINNMANFKETNLNENNRMSNFFAAHFGFGLFQGIMGVSSSIWNSRPKFIDTERKRTRAEEIPYIENKIFLSSISKTFRQAFPKSLLDVLCNLDISVDTQTSEGNSMGSMTNSDLYIEDSQNMESSEHILANSLDNDLHTTLVLNQLFKLDTTKNNPLLDIDEDDGPKIDKNKQNIDYGAPSNGANVEPRITVNKEKQMVIGDFKTLEIPDPIAIQNSGIKIFNEQMELFYVENFKNWKRYGEGKIQIWQTHEPILSYYLLLWDGLSNELLIHTKLDADWKAEFMDKSSNICHWMINNYASTPKGKLERLSLRFPDSKTAGKFMLFVDKCLDKLLLV